MNCSPDTKIDEIEVTPEMIRAGVVVLKQNYLALLDQVEQYSEIVRTLYVAMQCYRPRA